MTRRRWRWVATHLGVVAAGMLLQGYRLSLSRTAGQGDGGQAGVPGAVLPARPDRPAGTAMNQEATANSGSHRTQSELRQAWREIALSRVSREERMEAQREVLRQWAESDLGGALGLALTEEPGEVQSLLSAFDEIIRQRPLVFWGLIRRDDPLGPNAAMVRSYWTRQMLADNRDLLAVTVKDFPPLLQDESIASLIQRAMHFPEQWRLMKLMAAGDDPEQALQRVRRALYGGYPEQSPLREDAAALARMWQGQPDGPERRLGLVAWARLLGNAPPEDFSRAWQGVPEADRGEALRVALGSSNCASRAITLLMDQAVAAGQWDYLRDHGAAIMDPRRAYTGGVDFRAMADWAQTLPPRAETVGLYRAAVDGWLKSGEGGVAWLTQMPAGDWHREQGFSALAQQALLRGDGELVEQAIAGITDPVLKKEARGTWDRARGK